MLVFALTATACAASGCAIEPEDDDGIRLGRFPRIEAVAQQGTVRLDLNVDPSVAELYGLENGDVFSNGTGWVADARRGEIVTNAHVAVSGQSIAAVPSNEQEPRPATVRAANVCRDIALVDVERRDGLKTVRRADKGATRRGEAAFALGFPWIGDGFRGASALIATKGEVTVLDTRGRLAGYPHVIRTSAGMRPGMSGGPMLDDDGRLIGMNTFIGDEDEARDEYRSYGITEDYAARLLEPLRRGQSTSWLGWVFESLTYEDEPAEPVVEGLHGDKDFYGWSVVGRARGTKPVSGLVGDAGDREQYVYAIDGHRFGDDDSSLPAWSDQQEVCVELGPKQSGETSTLSIVEPKYDKDDELVSYKTFDVEVTYR